MDVRSLATDAIILINGDIVLLERTHDPHEGAWVLPGGLVERDERAREACAREAAEEIGLEVEPISFVGLYDEPDRDERGNVSAAYLCRPTESDPTPEPLEEARHVETFEPEQLPRMGFDHEDIVRDALSLRCCT